MSRWNARISQVAACALVLLGCSSDDDGAAQERSTGESPSERVEDAAVDAGTDAASAEANAAADNPGGVPRAGTLPISAPPEPMGCIDDVGPGAALTFGDCGGDVVFNVSVPEQCMEHACGLIFDVHGWTMSGEIEEMNTGIAAIGREEGYIVVQPSAPGTPPSWMPAMHDAVVSDFLRLAMQVWHVQAERVHFTGFSQGGAMTFRMRCALSDVLASVAPTSMAAMPCADAAREMDLLYIQGRNDYFVADEQIDATVEALTADGGFSVDRVVSEDENYTWTRYTNADGRVFEYIDHHYSTPAVNGHCFPGSLDPGGTYGCDQEAPFLHGRVVVDFFIAHPMPAAE